MSVAAGSAFMRRLGLDRWHFQHGPIDLIIDVDADAGVRERCVEACWAEFQGLLPGLVRELAELRRSASQSPAVKGAVARRMVQACAPFAAERFITPMAAVAGSVADHLIHVFDQRGVRRACINNGGDIAFLLTLGSSFRVGICSQIERLKTSPQSATAVDGAFSVRYDTSVRGVATSGWRGRSFSLGIADSVTVLARDAALADAAATLVANAVDCDHAGILRVPAEQLKDDSDLGDRLVTVGVPPLPAADVERALARGCAEARRWQSRGLIHAAALFLQDRVQLVMPLQVRTSANPSSSVSFKLSAA
jgi:ApbE superfamily uncharacterized protein (UPF0280 family)